MNKTIPIEVGGYPPTKTTPWQHQIDGWDIAKTFNEFLLGYDMGGGKSKSAVDFCNGFDADLILILCPKAVVDDCWPIQFELHSHKKYKVMTYASGSVEKKAKSIEKELRLARVTKQPLVIVINLDSCWREPLGPAYNVYNKIISTGLLVRQPWDMVIVDESQKIKSHNSKVSKYIHKLGKVSKRRLALSGTFLDDKPIDIFGQFRFLDESIYSKSFTKFKRDFVVEENCGQFTRYKGLKNEAEFHRRLYSRCHRILKRDVLDLPPCTIEEKYVTLCPKARKIYDELESTFSVELEDGQELNTDLIMVKLLRLSQIAGGNLPLEDSDGKVRDAGKIIDTSKMETLESLVDATKDDEPIVIFARFTSEVQRIKEFILTKKKRSCAELSGQRNELAEWKSGKHDVLVVQIRAGAAGIDLTRSCIAIFYSTGYSLGEFEQAVARVDRPGQLRPVNVYKLIARDTVDVLIQKSLRSKKSAIDFILDYHKNKRSAA